MSFDKDTRNALSKIVITCRRLLTEDVTDQLRGRFGMHPDGTILSIDRLNLVEDEKLRAQALRELLEHFAAGETAAAAAEKEAAENEAVAAERAQQCERARARLETYVQSPRVYSLDANGERVYLDDEQRQNARQKAEEQISELCS